MARRIHLLAASGLTAVAVLSLTGTAHAATYTVKDASNDVVTIDDGGHVYPRPHNAATDVTALTTRFAGRKVTVTTTLRRLQETDYGVDGEIKIPSKPLRYTFFYFVGASDGPDLVLSYDQKAITCRGLAARVDKPARQIVVKIPRSCLDGARVVRTGLEAISDKQIGPDPDNVDFFNDDAQQTGIADARSDFVLGPRVHRN